MITSEFEWDADKESTNLAKHDLSFAHAVAAFADAFAVEWIDDRQDYGEERVILLGIANGEVLTVVYTERESRIRIISARRATRYETEIYFGQNTP